jgi:putative endonuclease
MGYWVYILYSRSENVFYKGLTADLEDRCIRHNAGIEKATAHAIPWVCLWAIQKHSRSEALKLEKNSKIFPETERYNSC